MEIINKLKSLVNKFVGKSSGETTSNRFITSEISHIKMGLEASLTSITALTKNQNTIGILQMYLRNNLIYRQMIKKINGSIAHEELKQPLSTLKFLITITIQELDQLLKYLSANPNIEKNEEFQMLTMSQAAFVGVSETCNIIERFIKAFICKCLVVTVNYPITNDFKKAEQVFTKNYPWMENDINTNVGTVIEILTRYSYSKKMDLTEKVIELFKKINFDPKLSTEDGKPNTDFLDMFEESTQVSQCAFLGLGNLSIRKYWSQRKILKEHEKIMRQEYEVKWMENTITLLQYQQSGMSPEDPKYKELQKTIDYYAELIAKLSADINEYRNN